MITKIQTDVLSPNSQASALNIVVLSIIVSRLGKPQNCKVFKECWRVIVESSIPG